MSSLIFSDRQSFISEERMCQGYQFAGVASGLKQKGQKDLGLIYCEQPAHVAGVFTRNQVKAAPVMLDMQRITAGICQAVIVNSGNANCCTGEKGIRDAVSMGRRVAEWLGIAEEHVLVASTGVIGEPLAVERIQRAVPGLIEGLDPAGISNFAEAIMTTDTVPKIVSRKGNLDGVPFTVTGVAKGAGMIRPDMATLLCFIMTDVTAEPSLLKEVLVNATNRTLNRITIDGDTSTNDTALLLANGLGGAVVKGNAAQKTFFNLLESVLMSLGKMLVKDGEGATKVVEVVVQGAESERAARQIADTVAHSNLVKTALFGEDANWGRILGAAGRAGVPVEAELIDIFFGEVCMVRNGLGCGKIAEKEATRVLKKPEFSIRIDLKSGTAEASVFTCDFSIDYVKINADYRS
ncbi:MAG: bifunctional glutamate N-acetyltransferase/amino-acid acetyltransferase ArgJ [Desulfobacterales bacterium]|jgi:glutamate N-acetyltransferase/amino-acid N-acetyltransferase